MTNKQKIEKWLDKQIKATKVENADLKINESLTLCNASGKDYVHLYNCLQTVADILELPTSSHRVETLNNGSYIETSFIYKGVKFLEVSY